ncbi:MAG: winged helix-turn-helix transcriptional regulator [Saprospiraceae bacterium]|nr:winged helix-turn-helix transcriptional regulator [Saprospiraceae bacterium]
MDLLFKALNDATRRQILDLLKSGELSAGQIADQFNMSKPSVSHHLDLLKNAGLISMERRGQHLIYSLNTSVLEDLLHWIIKLNKQN